MRARRVESAAEFLAATEAWRAADPVRSNVLGSVATGVAQGRRYEREHLVAGRGRGRPGGRRGDCARRRTGCCSGPMPPEAADALADDVVALGDVPPGLVGPTPVARRVAERAGWATSVATQERILVLDELRAARRHPRFGPPRDARRPRPRGRLDRAVRRRRRHVPARPRESFLSRLPGNRFWVVDGEPVSFAGHAPLVDAGGTVVARVGSGLHARRAPPPRVRRRGHRRR